MNIQDFFPDKFQITAIEQRITDIIISLQSQFQSANCPKCQSISRKIHSTYFRKVMDSSILSKPVKLHIQVQKFFCLNNSCQRKIFVERHPEFLGVYRRSTQRFEKMLIQLALTLSAESVARFLNQNGYVKSGCAVLNLLRKTYKTRYSHQHLKYIGVDDFSFRRGIHFGTIICDLETNRPIELLRSRTTKDFCDWLKQHPGIELVTRDRATTYTKAINTINPSIIQVADKWHFLKNALEIIKGIISNYFPKGWYITEERQYPSNYQPISSHKIRQNQELSFKQQEKWKLIQLVQETYINIGSIRETAAQLKLNRVTVKKYLALKEVPIQQRRERINQFTPFLDKIILWCHEGKSASWIHKRLLGLGFTGASSSTRTKVQMIKEKFPPTAVSDLKQGTHRRLVASNFQLRSLLWRKPLSLTINEHEILQQLFHHYPLLSELYSAIQYFRDIVTYNHAWKLNQWLDKYKNHEIKPLKNFCIRMKRDQESVYNALIHPYTNAVCEGNVNRLKMIKRQMYGRAHFDLLRIKILHS